MSEGTNPPCRVVYSGDVRNAVRKLHAWAAQHGRKEAVLSALRTIDLRLHNDPRTFGEARYRLPAAKLEVRVAVVSPVYVLYAVHEEQPIVFVQEVDKLPRSDA